MCAVEGGIDYFEISMTLILRKVSLIQIFVGNFVMLNLLDVTSDRVTCSLILVYCLRDILAYRSGNKVKQSLSQLIVVNNL